MENMNDFSPPSPRFEEGEQPIALISHLMKSATDMRHIDELLLWVSNAMVYQLDMRVVQFWVTQAYLTGPSQTELRAAASKNSSITQDISANTHVVEVVEHLLHQQRGVLPLPVTHIFSPNQAEVLARYDLQYWAGYFLRRSVFLPPIMNEFATGQIATPLRMLAALFTQQLPSQRLLRATSFVMEQMLRVATSRGFLTMTPSSPSTPIPSSTSPVPPSTSVPPLMQPTQLSFADLVPQRTQTIEVLQNSNPFASAVVISDKNARRLYSAIDGRRSVTELADLTHLNQQEISKAFHFLFHQKHIHFCEPGGKPLESSSVLKML